MGDFLNTILPKISAYKGRLLGGAVGFIAGLIWSFKGFIAAFVFVLSILIGYFIGKRIDQKDSLKEILSRVLPPKN